MRKREGTDARTCVGVPAPGTEVSPAEKLRMRRRGNQRTNERTESESEDTNHGRVTDLRRLTSRSRSSASADAFVQKNLERLRVHEACDIQKINIFFKV